MSYNFDQIIDRRHSDSVKWRHYDEDVLPLWVADMDFVSPEPVVRALRERVAHGVFGYGVEPKELREILIARLANLYDWTVPEEAIVFVPGVVAAFNIASRAVTSPGDGVLLQTPVYGPFLEVPSNAHLAMNAMELTHQADGRYLVDMDRMAAAVTDRTRAVHPVQPAQPGRPSLPTRRASRHGRAVPEAEIGDHLGRDPLRPGLQRPSARADCVAGP